ncbi:MAG: carboxynorspermidine decarboxylase [Muribaculaceae bacterium]|nr:carboxynorspermidine decarboxylase [Muribaculaceae bacterium]
MNSRIDSIPTPFYVVYEDRLRRNLDLIGNVSRQSGADIIMAFKANALWRTFPIIREYINGCTASSVNELRLGREELQAQVHSYTPAYTDANILEFVEGSTHITFNSLSQLERFLPVVERYNNENDRHVSVGLRVNPHCSVIDTDIYNPALPGSRFGVSAKMLPTLPNGVEGLHFHALCESSADDLAKVLNAFETQFGHLLKDVKWVNMGGGHLMTREGYDTERLIQIIKDFRNRYPWINVILEPGSAFTWRTGDLISSVVDVVDNDNIKTAILDVSFACHMPDTLEMPYKPIVSESNENGELHYRLGGNSCLSGDFIDGWNFDKELKQGDRITLEDMNHYTTVKTTMFNGIHHPSIVFVPADQSKPAETLRHFTYSDYRSRMS